MLSGGGREADGYDGDHDDDHDDGLTEQEIAELSQEERLARGGPVLSTDDIPFA